MEVEHLQEKEMKNRDEVPPPQERKQTRNEDPSLLQEMQNMGNKRPLKVSVIITCYNYGKYLHTSINSVLKSTCKDVEIIVVDDGSTDPHTRRVLRQLRMKPNIYVIRQSNKGAASARNTGIRYAKGKYIYSLDADDKVHPKLLEKSVAVLDKHPKVGFVGSWLRYFGKARGVIRYRRYNFYTLLFKNIIPSGSMFRKIAWEQVGGYYERLRGFEDWEFWIALGARGWLGYMIPEPLFHYRKHKNSKLSQSLKRRRRLIQLIRMRHAHLYTKLSLAKLKRIWKPRSLLKKKPSLSNRAQSWRFLPSRRPVLRRRIRTKFRMRRKSRL
ncbi:glycosyltransferase family 2 protein [Brevibacillus sp. H7]|uniref:glycosyltransferase family 2 protein n=1 Tax=Brevibacillus sp. H7 TaxID=3349138 RepID=UPI00382880A6